MLVLAFVTAVFAMIVGVIFIVDKDRAWKIQEWSLKIVRPQRTPEWENSTTFRGVIMVVAGWIYFILLLISVFK